MILTVPSSFHVGDCIWSPPDPCGFCGYDWNILEHPKDSFSLKRLGPTLPKIADKNDWFKDGRESSRFWVGKKRRAAGWHQVSCDG